MPDKKLGLTHKFAGVIERLIKTTEVKNLELNFFRGNKALKFNIAPKIKRNIPHISYIEKNMDFKIIPELIEIIGKFKENQTKTLSLSEFNTKIKTEPLNIFHTNNVFQINTSIKVKTENIFEKYNISPVLKYKTRIKCIDFNFLKPVVLKAPSFKYPLIRDNLYLIKKTIIYKKAVQVSFLSEEQQLTYWRKAVMQSKTEPKSLELIGVYYQVPYYSIENIKIDFKLKQLSYKLKENSVAKKIKEYDIIIFRDIIKKEGIIIED